MKRPLEKTLLRLDGQVVTGNMAASLVTIASRNGPVRSPATLIEGLKNHWRVGIRVINEQAARNQMRTLVNTGFLDEDGNLTESGAYIAEVVKELDDDLSQVHFGIDDLPF